MKEVKEDIGSLGKNLNKFYEDLEDFTEPFKETVSGRHMVEILISHAVGMACHCTAPNELEAMKAIMSSIETGILEYEEKKSKKGVKK